MKKVINTMCGIIIMSLILSACGSSNSTESKIIGVWKLEEPDGEVTYLEFAEDRLVVRELNDKMSSLHYYITDLENKNFLLEVSMSDGGFKQIILEGTFVDKNTIGVLHNPSATYSYEDNEVKMVRIKDLEKDMEKETEKLSKLENEDASEDDEGFSQESSDEDFSQEPSDEEIKAMEIEAKEKEAMEQKAAQEQEEYLATATDTEQLYVNSCASCHGYDLSGDLAPDLSSIGSKMSAEEIEKVIVEGQGAMPGGILADEEARAVAEWLSEMK